MSKNTNTKNGIRYGLVFKNHGKWSKNPSFVFTEHQIAAMGGRNMRNISFKEKMDVLLADVAKERKQRARAIQITN